MFVKENYLDYVNGIAKRCHSISNMVIFYTSSSSFFSFFWLNIYHMQNGKNGMRMCLPQTTRTTILCILIQFRFGVEKC